ncbi:helix-turn-helix domain-containing protein [Pseudodonghicola flavimaris]|uniref:Helix-turn-helix domain-containing protein n=1 Tax=Pseudodonghicola flavimaris TaxID=3050036 RepID=A0ABT7EXF9_9RHOB|nr:hypothetical protein [Pseudodonghicola flavimaris]MDK3017040.1 hypothetical protein [Pseudodonghicola flavimaris]
MSIDLENHEMLKCRLRLAGSSMAKIARSLGVSPSTVTVVSQGYRNEKLVGEGAAAFARIRPGTEIKIRKLPGSRTVFQWVRSYQAADYSALSLIPATHLSGNRTRR